MPRDHESIPATFPEHRILHAESLSLVQPRVSSMEDELMLRHVGRCVWPIPFAWARLYLAAGMLYTGAHAAYPYVGPCFRHWTCWTLRFRR